MKKVMSDGTFKAVDTVVVGVIAESTSGFDKGDVVLGIDGNAFSMEVDEAEKLYLELKICVELSGVPDGKELH